MGPGVSTPRSTWVLRSEKGKIVMGWSTARSLMESASTALEDAVRSYSARSRRRYMRAGFGAITNLMARAGSLVVSLITIPITLPYLGTERFGMWMTIASLASLLSFTGLGVSLSLLQSVASADGSDSVFDMRSSISNALAASLGTTVALLALALIVVPAVPWSRVFNVTSVLATGEATPSVVVFLGVLLIGMPVGLSASVNNGLQHTYTTNIAGAIGSFASLVGIVVCVRLGLGLPELVLALSGGALVAGAVNTLALAAQRPDLRPSRSLVTLPGIRAMFQGGASFLLIQLAFAVAVSSDPIVVAQVQGAPAVADYSTVYRLFLVPAAIGAAITAPLWPGFREAWARGEREWVRQAFVRTLVVMVGTVVALSAGAVLAGPSAMSILGQGKVKPELMLYVAFGFMTVVMAIGSAESILLNSLGLVRVQVTVWSAMALSNIVLGVCLTQRIGTAGVVWATAVTVGVSALILARLIHALVYKAANA